MHVEVVKKEILADTDILKLIPQREPMVMVSGLLAADEKGVTTYLRLEKDNIFVQDGLFRESGLIENIAQSAAAMNGYRALISGEPVKKGYIGGIKNMEVFALPKSGVRLTTRVRETYNVMDASIIEGEVYCGDQLISRCEMKVFMQA